VAQLEERGLENRRSFLEALLSEKRVGQLGDGRKFWLAVERLPMLLAVYPDSGVEPVLRAPESELQKAWERPDAVREVVRGRMEIIGPVTAEELSRYFTLPQKEIEAALLALEAEGFILRGKFHPGTPELEWCDRRLLARIHRLTINRLRAEIQPVSIAEFQRFLLAWQRVAPEHRATGPEGLEAVLELLDGYELPAAAWEPEVLSLRVKDYSPQWLDQLCLAGRIGWGRLTPPQTRNGRPAIPIRSSPVSFFVRSHLSEWLQLCAEPGTAASLASRTGSGGAGGSRLGDLRQFRGIARLACASGKAHAIFRSSAQTPAQGCIECRVCRTVVSTPSNSEYRAG